MFDFEEVYQVYYQGEKSFLATGVYETKNEETTVWALSCGEGSKIGHSFVCGTSHKKDGEAILIDRGYRFEPLSLEAWRVELNGDEWAMGVTDRALMQEFYRDRWNPIGGAWREARDKDLKSQ